MKLLILGGTRFLGRHLAEQALAAGHELTLLHRGQSGPALFPQARHLVADRNGDLSLLADGHWDVVIDTNAYVPRHVHSVAAWLKGRIGTYQLVSTISVYTTFTAASIDEDAALATLPDDRIESVDGNTYGGLKVLCEQAARAAFGEACLIARPGLLVGPHDPTDRFSWWVERVARGGDMLAPAPSDAPVQFIDARDAAAWLLRQAERQTRGVFNLTGPVRPPHDPLTMGEMLATLRQALGADARPVWADEPFLLGQGVTPWSDLPVWVGRAEAGLHRVDIGRAVATGLACRPLAQTAVDTAAWLRQRLSSSTPASTPASTPPGLDPDREEALLAAWRQHTGA